MKKTKLLFGALLALFTFSLSSCSLFSDDDIAIKNEFKPYVPTSTEETGVKAGDVYSKNVEEVPNTYCFKSISYAKDEKITNTYKIGGLNENEYNVNNNEDYYGNKSRNNYDLYVPTNLNKSEKNTVMLFIHGGAWVSGFKTDVNQYVYEFAKKGYITATLKYTLLSRTMDDASLSIFRNLDEIDQCLKSIKEVLKNDLGFDDTKLNLVIGGASSGSHLAMLYSYSRGENCPIPIKFIINAVGPVDIKENAWRRFINQDDALDGGITKTAIATQVSNGNIARLTIAGEDSTWNDYQTMRIANGMCGIPYSVEDIEATTDENREVIVNPNAASNSMTKVGGGEDLLSITYWINNSLNDYPIICAYGGRDSIVGINQFATLQSALDDKSIDYEFIYFKNSSHTDITKEADSDAYTQLINKIEEWCSNI